MTNRWLCLITAPLVLIFFLLSFFSSNEAHAYTPPQHHIPDDIYIVPDDVYIVPDNPYKTPDDYEPPDHTTKEKDRNTPEAKNSQPKKAKKKKGKLEQIYDYTRKIDRYLAKKVYQAYDGLKGKAQETKEAIYDYVSTKKDQFVNWKDEKIEQFNTWKDRKKEQFVNRVEKVTEFVEAIAWPFQNIPRIFGGTPTYKVGDTDPTTRPYGTVYDMNIPARDILIMMELSYEREDSQGKEQQKKYLEELNENGWTVSTRVPPANYPNGFQATTFEHKDGKIMIAIRGTDEKEDYIIDGQLVIGAPYHEQEQYQWARKYYEEVVKEYGEDAEIYFAGHSLAGNNQQRLAIETKRPTVTFNAPGLKSQESPIPELAGLMKRDKIGSIPFISPTLTVLNNTFWEGVSRTGEAYNDFRSKTNMNFTMAENAANKRGDYDDLIINFTYERNGRPDTIGNKGIHAGQRYIISEDGSIRKVNDYSFARQLEGMIIYNAISFGKDLLEGFRSHGIMLDENEKVAEAMDGVLKNK